MMTKPMLASAVDDVSKLIYPLIATPKIDGIRALKLNGKLVSRSFKPIPNEHVRASLEKSLPDGLDGELVVGKTFQDCSAVMKKTGTPDFEFCVFDYFGSGLSVPYTERLALASQLVDSLANDSVWLLEPEQVNNESELLAFEQRILAAGYEGVMLRSLDGPYKCGRSTLKEHFLLKLKRFEDSEAEVIGFVEQMHNTNEAYTDEIGRTKRSSAKDGKVSTGLLGAFKVRDFKTGVEFEIGTGLTAQQRSTYWSNRHKLVKRKALLKYKFQPIGVKEKPRCPVFLGFRQKEDM